MENLNPITIKILEETKYNSSTLASFTQWISKLFLFKIAKIWLINVNYRELLLINL